METPQFRMKGKAQNLMEGGQQEELPHTERAIIEEQEEQDEYDDEEEKVFYKDLVSESSDYDSDFEVTREVMIQVREQDKAKTVTMSNEHKVVMV